MQCSHGSCFLRFLDNVGMHFLLCTVGRLYDPAVS